ncbi:DNA-binding winged helix-turn-helix (wHTH) protein [Tahibacter aquaticus]|uniref:DNA-binding winged helix-turn-helix (WHTH) protein n=1 Tax=Tahibacter aquaticus TaxID=520092 RepID=A0A4R6YSB9_9GAMM|nr:winged helix-turn-helix domain-containing protein [Tahibacter aquaticus]TDR41100.1 DNA-binding winged helix-turn-helix (wHTH) protein [Tahibacter aquaticus]
MSEHFRLPWPAAQRRLHVGGIEIDLRYRRVVRADGEIELAQRIFDLLLLFLAHPGVLQSRNDIFRQVWPGVVVEDANLTQSIWLLRRALGAGAKDWIRTVAKLGYVFDPPQPVQWADEATTAASPVSLPAAAPPAPAVVAPQAPLQRGWRDRRRAVAATVLAALALLLSSALWWKVSAQAPRRIVLAAASDPGGTEAAAWPVHLLQAWLEWKLRASSEVQLAQVSADSASQGDDVVVLLSAAPGDGEAGSWQLGARLRGNGIQHDLILNVTAAGLVPGLDSLSRDVHRVLAAESAAQAWPALQLDARAAAEFVAGLHDEQRHRRASAAQHYQAVIAAEPDFGYARLRLAQDLAELGQQGAAEAQLPRLREWVAALPPPVRAMHQADLLALAQDFDQAAAAFNTLQQSNSADMAAMRLAQARNLRRGGRSEDALRRLGGEVPAQPRQAVPWLLERAIAELVGGEPLRARVSASQAAAQAARLGWEHEQARALSLLADAAGGGAEGDATALLQQAQELYVRSDDRLGALRAHFLAQLLRDDAAAQRQALDQLLAEARAAGNVAVEFDALRRSAFHFYRKGEMPAYAERLAQAVAVADAAGDRHARTIASIDLLHQELLQGDSAAADRRLALLDTQPLQGMASLWFSHFAASVAYDRGDYARARQLLDRAEQVLAGDSTRTGQVVGLSCLRGAIALAQGESMRARNAFGQCRAPQLPHYQIYADVGEAELALQAGDLAQSRRLLAAARSNLATLDSTPDRSKLVLVLAPLLARSGDLDGARRLVQAQQELLQRAGYVALSADAHLALAEIALAAGQLDLAASEAARSGADLPADNWQSRRRLRTVQALLAQRRGDTALAAQLMDALDADARRHADVLGELLVHSIAETNPRAAHCSAARHGQLLAKSGLRGASDLWLLDAAGADVAAQLAAARGTP